MAKKTPQTINRGVLSLDDIERAGIRYSALPEPPAPAPAAEEGSGLIRRLVGDTGVSLLKGAIGVPEAAIGLADLATGGRAGKLAEDAGFRAKDAKRLLDEFYSPEQRAANAEVSKAEGVVDTLGAAVANPSTILHAVVESAPSLLGAGGVARGALAVAPRLGGAVAAGLGEGVVSAGQTAEQVRQETDGGHLSGSQSLLAAGSGALTGLLGAAAGKVANRLGIGDVNQLVAGVRNAGPEVQKGVVRKLIEGFASEGLLQEFPQSAQEQIAQNVALGKQWDEGVANAATMGALAGGLMGAGAAPFGHGAQPPAQALAPSPADEIRATKLPESGVLTKSVNAGIEAQATAVGATQAPLERFSFSTEEQAAEFARKFNPEWQVARRADGGWSFVETQPLATEASPAGAGAQVSPDGSATEVSQSFDQRLQAVRDDIGGPDTLQALRDQFGRTGASDVLKALSAVQQRGLPARTRERMLSGIEDRLAALRMSVLEEAGSTPPQIALPAPDVLPQLGNEAPPAQIGFDQRPTGVVRVDAAGNAAPETAAQAIDTRNVAAEQLQPTDDRQARRASGVWADEAPRAPAPLAAPLALDYDTAPTGVVRVDAAGRAAPETVAQAIDTRNAAEPPMRSGDDEQARRASAVWADEAPRAPGAPLAIEFDQRPTGRMIADEAGTVRTETRADEINRQQSERQERERAAARAELGLTPDVDRATMRAAMGNVTQDGDLLTAGGVPFRNRRAAAAAVARAGDGYQVVEIGPDSFVGRRQAEVGAAAPVPEETQAAAPAPREVPEMLATNGKPFKSKQIASIRARQNPGFTVVEVDGGWALRKPAADLAGEQLNKDWTAFAEETGSMKIPRAEMPQVKAEHRGALVNFLNARGVAHEQGEVPAHVLKPTQAEYSPAKVEQAKNFTGGERSILASRDGHVLDGHHQWLAARDGGQNIKTIVFDAPIEQLLREVKEFPSAAIADGATPAAEGQGDLLLSRRAPDATILANDTEEQAKARADAEPAPAPTVAGGDRSIAEGSARLGGVGEDGAAPPALKRAPPAALGIAADEIREALNPTVERWRSGPAGGVTVVQSFDDLPANIQTGLKALNAEGIVRALFMPRDQSVYLVADNLKSVEEAQFALFHEVYGHLGLRSLLSKGAFEDTMIRMQRSNPGLRQEADQWFAQHGADEVAARVSRGMKNGPATREVALLAVEEALADRAGKNVPISGLRFLLARIQKALRAIGFEHVADWMEARTDAEVLDLLSRARASVHAELRPWEGAQGAPAMSTKDADGPVLSRTPAQAVNDLTPQIVKDLIDGQRGFRSLHWWHKSVGTMYDLAEKNPSFRKVYDAAQAFLRDTSTFASDAADQAPRVLPQLNELKELGKALTLPEADRKAIAAPIFEGTLEWARDDAGKLLEAPDVESAGVVFTDQELRDQFKLDDRQIELYREFRAAVDRSLDSTGAADVIRYLGDDATDGMRNLARSGEFKALKDVVLDHIDKMPLNKLQATMREEVVEKYDRLEKLKAAGYAPLSRFGQYAVHVQSKLNKTEFFGLYESSTDAARAARLLAKDFPHSSIQRSMMSQENYKQLKGISPETAMLFAKITGMDKNVALQDWIKNAAANRSAMKRMIKRKGTEGYSEDVTRVLSSFITSNARAASQGLHVGEMKVLTDAIHEGDVKDMAVKLTEYVENPMEEAAALRGFMFVHFLGGSLASAAVNMTQPFMMTMPYLSQFVGITGAAKAISKYTAAAAGGKVIDEDMRSALHIAEKEGIVSPQEVHQLQAMAMGRGSMFANAARFLGANDRVASAADTAGKRAMFIWGAPFALAEQFNRRLTFMAAYQVAKDKGMPDPFKFASKAVVETQGVYNRANKPMWARGAIGATLFTFKQYSISYLEFMKRMWTAGEAGSQERADGRKAALFAMAVLIMAAGASGLPGADDLDDLIDTIGQRMGHDTSSKRWKQENLPAWLNYGFSALPGIPLDVAGRLGIGNLLPGTGLLRKDKSDKSGDVLEAFGPAGAVAKGVLDAADTKSIDPILPTAIKNLLKGVDTAVHGAYRDTKGRRVVDATPVDAAVKAIGFQPATVAGASRADGIQISRQALARNIEAEIASAWASARFENDLAAEKEARQRLADWNETNPDTPIGITMGQIQKRLRQMRMTRQQRLGKSATKEIRAADARAN